MTSTCRNARRSFCLAALALVLAGCSIFGSSSDRAARNSPDYREGYGDGCAAATDQGADLRDRPVGDASLYKSDETYRAGWSSGFQICRRTDMQPGASPADNPIRDPVPGAH
ncbi:MAG TPA: hypothetical protein VG274_10500 [Rhizomicrobium sp.]|nr:hypothetical protein [Rhizomicrobium sp.]